VEPVGVERVEGALKGDGTSGGAAAVGGVEPALAVSALAPAPGAEPAVEGQLGELMVVGDAGDVHHAEAEDGCERAVVALVGRLSVEVLQVGATAADAKREQLAGADLAGGDEDPHDAASSVGGTA
jgi:hypothetical protein